MTLFLPYIISATVSGQRHESRHTSIDAAMDYWRQIATTHIVPGTQDIATELSLAFGERVIVTLG